MRTLLQGAHAPSSPRVASAMPATMVLGRSLRQTIVPAHLMGRDASTSRMLAMCAAPGLLLTMTAVTASKTSNHRVEAALRAAARADGPVHPASNVAGMQPPQ